MSMHVFVFVFMYIRARTQGKTGRYNTRDSEAVRKRVSVESKTEDSSGESAADLMLRNKCPKLFRTK